MVIGYKYRKTGWIRRAGVNLDVFLHKRVVLTCFALQHKIACQPKEKFEKIFLVCSFKLSRHTGHGYTFTQKCPTSTPPSEFTPFNGSVVIVVVLQFSSLVYSLLICESRKTNIIISLNHVKYNSWLIIYKDIAQLINEEMIGEKSELCSLLVGVVV